MRRSWISLGALLAVALAIAPACISELEAPGGGSGDQHSSGGGDSTAAGDATAGDSATPVGDSSSQGDPSPAGNECDNWQTQHPEWLHCDGFETTLNLSDTYNDVSTNGMFVSTADPYTGGHSLEQHYTTGQVDAGWISWFFADALGNDYGPIHQELFVRWYHKFESGFEGAPPKMARMRSLGPGWDKRFSILHWVASGSADLEISIEAHVPDSSQANGAGWLPNIYTDFHFADPGNIGRWTCHEMQIKNNGSGQTDGLYRVWADGVLIAERLDADLSGSTGFNLNEMMLDAYWNDGSPKEQSRFYDNFVISTERIGCAP